MDSRCRLILCALATSFGLTSSLADKKLHPIHQDGHRIGNGASTRTTVAGWPEPIPDFLGPQFLLRKVGLHVQLGAEQWWWSPKKEQRTLGGHLRDIHVSHYWVLIFPAKHSETHTQLDHSIIYSFTQQISNLFGSEMHSLST